MVFEKNVCCLDVESLGSAVKIVNLILLRVGKS